jgi:peptidoglycan/LPS O-acetylase OafA/YrhL
MGPSNNQRIFGLDLMRATAILMVLVGHCSWIFPESDSTFAALLALSGFLGVEIFFVLSGFLIGRIIYRQFTTGDFNTSAVMHFLKRRWFRTFPNYFLVLVVNIILWTFLGFEIQGLWQYFFFVQNFASPMLPFFTESWSLSVEEFAYVILPFGLLLVFMLFKPKNKPRQFLTVTLLLIVIFMITKIFYNINTSNNTIETWNLAVKSVVIYRLDSIFIGVLAGWIYENHRDFWIRTKNVWMVLGFIMLIFYTFGVGFFQLLIDRYPFFWNVVYLPLASISVAFFLPILSEWKSEKSFLYRPITFISLVSYSIYLLHYGIVLQLMKQVVDTETLPLLYATLFTIAYFGVSIILSALLYRYYEKPMMDRRERTSANLD